jgi:RNA polymerase sigma factor (sigma-70 family)
MPQQDALIMRPTGEFGETEAREFVEAHWDLVFRSAYFICADHGAAEDIAQEAMVKALRGIARLDGSLPIGPWLSTIAANAAKDWLRKRARRPEEILGRELTETFGVEPDLADSLARDSLPDDLATALLALGEPQRTVIVMRHLLDLDTAEIAGLLEVAPATVRTRLHRGLAQLRTALEHKEETDA